jgi:SAM-dependent methyltransferase
VDPKLAQLMKYGLPFAERARDLPPVGYPRDFLRDDIARTDEWCGLTNIVARLNRDPFPIPHTENRELYCGDDHLHYWMTGLSDYDKVTATIRPYGMEGGRYYDFGGGTGRVFRHFAAQSDAWEVWSSDFRLSSVDWNLLHYPTSIKTFANIGTPALPLPDGYFDLVTAYSVFTHIDEFELPWLLELRRILKPGGIAYLSYHDEETWRVDGRVRELVTSANGWPLDAPLPAGKTVGVWREDDPYNCNVFQTRDYIDRVWGRFFEILEVRPLELGAQAVAVCRRPLES